MSLRTLFLLSEARISILPTYRTPRCDLRNQTKIGKEGGRIGSWVENEEKLNKGGFDGCMTTYTTIRHGAIGAHEMLGTRLPDLTWKWLTYKEVLEMSDQISKALRILNIPSGETSKIGIYSKNRPEWIMTDIAAHNFSNVTVPIYDTILEEDVGYIVDLCDMQVIFVDSQDKTDKLLTANLPSLKYIVQFDEIKPNSTKSTESIKICSFQDLIKLGKSSEDVPHLPPTPESLATISFTSGTTGRPKGVMLTHQNLCTAGLSTREFVRAGDKKEAYLSYLPLAHIYERVMTLDNFAIGAKVGFYRGDPQYLLEDIQSLAPHTVATVPRVIDKIHKGVVNKLTPIQKNILEAAIGYKLWWYRMSGKATRDTWVDKYILHKVQKLLGPNVKQLVIAAAKSDRQTLRFMRGALGVEVLEAYGQTETSGPLCIQLVGDSKYGTVGPPLECAQIKLEDVPELGYRVDRNGGEILAKGYNVTSGYFKNPQATSQSFTADGFLKTGDIGRFTPQGTLQIIDRRKNVIKLPQGKFVAADTVESRCATSRFVQQVYVHAEASRPWLVAVVVPEEQYLKQFALENYKITGSSYQELCSLDVLAQDVLKDFNKIREAEKRPKYEGVYGVFLTPTLFSPQNDLTTPTMKNKRKNLEKHFEGQIADMYRKLEELELGEFR